MKRIFKVLMTTLVAMLVLAVQPVAADAAAKPEVRLNKSKLTVYEGAQVQLKQTGSAKKYTWWSNNQKVASVNSKGLVKAKRKGTATIVLKAGNKKARCTVTVKAKLTTSQIIKKLEYQTKNYKNLTVSMYTKSIKYQNLFMRIAINKKDKIMYMNMASAVVAYTTDDMVYMRDPETKKWYFQKNEEGLDEEDFDIGESLPKTAKCKRLSDKTFNGKRCARLQVVDKKEELDAVYYFDLCDYSLVGAEATEVITDGKEEGVKMITVYDFKTTVKIPASVTKNAVSMDKYEF